MMTNRVLVSALAVTMLFSFQVQAMNMATGFVRFAFQHKKLTIGTVAALVGIYACKKKGYWPFRKHVGATTQQEQPSLGESFVAVDSNPLTYSQQVQAKGFQQEATTLETAAHLVKAGGNVLVQAAKTAAPYVQQGYTDARPYGQSVWQATKNGAYNAWNSGAVATVQENLTQVATEVKNQAPSFCSKAAQNVVYGTVYCIRKIGNLCPFGRSVQKQSPVVSAVPTLASTLTTESITLLTGPANSIVSPNSSPKISNSWN